jgi:hypothetical protein
MKAFHGKLGFLELIMDRELVGVFVFGVDRVVCDTSIRQGFYIAINLV